MQKKIIAEFIGTAAFLMSILYILAGKINIKNVPPSVLIGAALAVLIEINQVSEGHYNPAVSLMMLYKGNLTNREFPWYVMAQSLGAIVAVHVFPKLIK